MASDRDDADFEPPHRSSPIDHVLSELQLYGYRPFQDEPLFRDLAADQFERHTGSSWRPRSGSMANHRTLTAAMIDSRDFLAAKRRAETEVPRACRPETGASSPSLILFWRPDL